MWQLISIINESEIIDSEFVTIDMRNRSWAFAYCYWSLKDGYVSNNIEIHSFTALKIRKLNNYSRLKMANEVLCG